MWAAAAPKQQAKVNESHGAGYGHADSCCARQAAKADEGTCCSEQHKRKHNTKYKVPRRLAGRRRNRVGAAGGGACWRTSRCRCRCRCRCCPPSRPP